MLVTTQCFMKCDGCIFNNPSPKEIPINKIIKTARNLYSSGYKKITITGGDPLCRKDIRQIIDSLYEIGFRIHLDTTGFPLLKYFILDGLDKKIYLIGIPLDGSTNTILKEFRTNCPLSINDIEHIIEILEKYHFRISINTVVHAYNIDDLQNIYDIISKHKGVVRWELHQFSPAMSTKKSLEISVKDFKSAISKIRNNCGLRISPKPSSQKILNKVILFENGGDGGI